MINLCKNYLLILQYQMKNIKKSVIDNKKTKQYFLEDQTKVYFNSDFDNGNLEKVQKIAPYIYKIYPGFDKISHSTNKTFFHFRVYGFQMCTVRFNVVRVQILQKLLKTHQEAIYHPIIRKGNGSYERLPGKIDLYYNKASQCELSFIVQFDNDLMWYELSFSYPYSYQDCQILLKELKNNYQKHDQIYYHQQVLGFTVQQREINLITITEKINCSKQRQEPIQYLFPDEGLRPYKIDKPVIIISGRVHPGEAPASYCVEGVIRFLLNQKDYRSYLLRKNFNFIIIPMLNPDAVYHGMFRSDMNGDNLNRFYQYCNKVKHPSIWLFTKLLQQYKARQQKIAFYFDFHAHPSKKQFFIYGNSFNNFIHQVEAQTFGKILEYNCPYFHNIDSIFHEKQMMAKDKIDDHSKQGCGRVYVHKLFSLIHSYTVECGYFSPGKLHQLFPVETNSIFSGQYQYTNEWEKCSSKYYTPQSYKLMGKSILITVLDLFHLNPYPRTINNQFRSVNNIRKAISVKIFSNVQKFRMIDSLITKKMKELTDLIEEGYYKVRFGEFGLSVSENHGIKFKKRTYSLNSNVYKSKISLKNQITESYQGQAQQYNERLYYKQIRASFENLIHKKIQEGQQCYNKARTRKGSNQEKNSHSELEKQLMGSKLSSQKKLVSSSKCLVLQTTEKQRIQKDSKSQRKQKKYISYRNYSSSKKNDKRQEKSCKNISDAHQNIIEKKLKLQFEKNESEGISGKNTSFLPRLTIPK